MQLGGDRARIQYTTEWCQSSCFPIILSMLLLEDQVNAFGEHVLEAWSWEESGTTTTRQCGRALQSALHHSLYTWFELAPLPILQGQCSEWTENCRMVCFPEWHAPSDRPFVEIPAGFLHSTHISNAFSCLRLQGCFVIRTYFILGSHLGLVEHIGESEL